MVEVYASGAETRILFLALSLTCWVKDNVSLGLAVMDIGNFVKCLKISAEKPYVRAVFCCSGTG